MAQVLVRNLDDHVVERLKQKAAAKGCSLEQHLREVLTEAARLDREEFIRIADQIRESVAARQAALGLPPTDSTELVRQMRDERTRHLAGLGPKDPL